MLAFTTWGLAALAILADAQAVSKTARCGPQFGLTCHGSKWGNCCSQYHYCGSTTDYCGTGCQIQWGTCNSISSPARSFTTLPRSSSVQSSSAPAAPTLKVTTNARCGKGFGSTCKGSQWGDCCSQYSYCGSTANYCGTGCQQGFGTCNPFVPSSIRSSSRSSSTRLSSSATGSSSSSLRSSSMSSSSSVASSSASSSVASSTVASSSVASSTVASSTVASSTIASSSNIPSSSSSSVVSSSASSSVVPSSSTVVVPTTTSSTSSIPSPAPCLECCSNGVKGLYITSATGLTCLDYNLAVLICGAIPTTTACQF